MNPNPLRAVQAIKMLSAQSSASSEVLCARSAFPGEFGGGVKKSKGAAAAEKLQLGGIAFQALGGKNQQTKNEQAASSKDGDGGHDDLFLFKATPLKCVGHLLK